MTTTAGDSVLELDYPLAFARAFSSTLSRQTKRFRYLHLTGAVVERDQMKSLWYLSGVRKTKGQGETQMIEFAKDPATNGLWETIVARPGMVVKRGTYIGETSMMLTGVSGSFIRSDELALALIDAVLHGSEDLLKPAALLRRGQELRRMHGGVSGSRGFVCWRDFDGRPESLSAWFSWIHHEG
ncbi:hypothetical protein FB567DRAFT_544662 [Paraphoma chrysanthemicola]|uniref:Uncharacterized protein n=1 Tax=Paraphoma chrysanthemicola TaxID=798071 RepID=A0A8K0RHY1_9PLEO|nr:hypothetical protein FB567DRAFT_544662 [Paraphoma chrysanthemicola]